MSPFDLDPGGFHLVVDHPLLVLIGVDLGFDPLMLIGMGVGPHPLVLIGVGVDHYPLLVLIGVDLGFDPPVMVGQEVDQGIVAVDPQIAIEQENLDRRYL